MEAVKLKILSLLVHTEIGSSEIERYRKLLFHHERLLDYGDKIYGVM